MRRTYLMVLLLASAVAVVQSAYAQDTTVAQPNSMPRAESNSGISHETTSNGSSVNANMNAANAMVTQATPQAKKKHKVQQQWTNPEDPNKSPWWEPRDWNYISHQIGG